MGAGDRNRAGYWRLGRAAAGQHSRERVSVLGTDGIVHVEPFYTVMGFAATKYGLAILGRASQKQVVNVAQRGGMCSVLVGRSADASWLVPGSLAYQI